MASPYIDESTHMPALAMFGLRPEYMDTIGHLEYTLADGKSATQPQDTADTIVYT